jgi:HEAT repeat protein
MKSQQSPRWIAIHGHSDDPQPVIDALAAENPAHRATALGAAARLKILDDNILLNALRDPSDVVRRRAAELAPRGHAKSPHTVAAIVELLGDPACAEVAAFALGEFGDLPADTATSVIRALAHQATSHDDPLCRESAVAALGSLGTGRSAVLAATDDVATVRRRAIIALANFEGPDVDAALAKARHDRDWQVRQAAEDLLS